MTNCGTSALGNKLKPMMGTVAATITNNPSAASSVVFGLRKRPAQRRTIDVVNDLHHPLQQLIGKQVEASDQSRHLSRWTPPPAASCRATCGSPETE